ncbi:hypothetical protein HD553DRAFT_347349 [Filobasidium floriforme]|uniref:uncharacterized protein n=1 Tax=Filobasidium floriforme TaxID=5210 RepID=UPI001E8E5D49|nr:uncharacterized protein HD553DRAFT_347349 [Filobasidium floriforme]KAH8090901.1 hypothetical protein HD553DRAFT_347349 [Filobasidium floriforme]
MVVVLPDFKKVTVRTGSDSELGCPQTEAVVVIHMDHWSNMADEEYVSLRETYDSIIEQAWRGLTITGDRISGMQIFLKCDDTTSSKLYNWWKGIGGSVWYQEGSTMWEWAESSYKSSQETYHNFVYVFITDDDHSELHPLWTQISEREGVITAHHHRYPRDVYPYQHPDLHYYLQRTNDKDAETDGQSSNDTEPKELKQDKAAGFVAFLKDTAKVYKDLCNSNA